MYKNCKPHKHFCTVVYMQLPYNVLKRKLLNCKNNYAFLKDTIFLTEAKCESRTTGTIKPGNNVNGKCKTPIFG